MFISLSILTLISHAMSILALHTHAQMARKFILPLLLVFTTSLFSQDQKVRVVTRIVTDTIPAWNTWKGEGCSMNYPGAWHAGPAIGGDTIVVFHTVGDGHSPVSTISLIIRDDHGKGPSSKDLPQGVETIASEGPDASGAYSVEFSGKVDGTPLHGSQRTMVQDRKAYILTFTTAPDSFKDELFLVEAMMNSFALPKDN